MSNLEKELGELYSWEKEELEHVITELQTIIASKISEDTVRTLNSVERSLSVIREKYTLRILSTLKRSG